MQLWAMGFCFDFSPFLFPYFLTVLSIWTEDIGTEVGKWFIMEKLNETVEVQAGQYCASSEGRIWQPKQTKAGCGVQKIGDFGKVSIWGTTLSSMIYHAKRMIWWFRARRVRLMLSMTLSCTKNNKLAFRKAVWGKFEERLWASIERQSLSVKGTIPWWN